MNIIFNADDFGFSKGVNLGILEGFKSGIVTSATMMANVPAFDHGIGIYTEHKLSMGVHLTLTWGRPLCNGLKTIVTKDNMFYRYPEIINNLEKFDENELREEFLAQICKIKNAGVDITHLDSHQHVHGIPIVAEILADIAKKLKLPVRRFSSLDFQQMLGKADKTNLQPDNLDSFEIYKNAGITMTDNFEQGFYGKSVSEELLIEILEKYNKYKDKSLEIMCHPAYVDQELIDGTSYSINRALELQVLCSASVSKYIFYNNFNLVNYGIFA